MLLVIKHLRHVIFNRFSVSCLALVVLGSFQLVPNEMYHTSIFNPKKVDIQLYYKDSAGAFLHDFTSLQTYVALQKKELIFATNAGMFHRSHAPVGLFVQKGNTVASLNFGDDRGNFYLKPNGVFYLTKKGEAKVVETEKYDSKIAVEFATQSGPMLVIDGVIHKAFMQDSKNLNIRSGVGVLPNGDVVFVLSKQPVNFYDFAAYFISLGCVNALYLDGAISQMFEKGVNTTQSCTGKFGVLIGVCER